MSQGDDRAMAVTLLREMTMREIRLRERNGTDRLTPGVAVELAKMLAHIAGGDGRGVYSIEHHPEGDRVG